MGLGLPQVTLAWDISAPRLVDLAALVDVQQPNQTSGCDNLIFLKWEILKQSQRPSYYKIESNRMNVQLGYYFSS